MQARPIRYLASSILLPGLRLWSRYLKNDGGAVFRILTFHNIRSDRMPVFSELLDYLLANHRFVTPAEAERLAAGEAEPAGNHGRVPYLVTFDDGFRSNYEVARSVLAPRGIKAIFFVVPGIVGAPMDVQRRLMAQYVFDGNAQSVAPDLEMMHWPEIRQLRDEGHTIGSHTLSHRRLSELSDNELLDEISGSRSMLSEQIGEEVHWFAYPFGNVESISAKASELVRQTYRFSCTAVRGLNRGGSALALFRENVELDSPLSYQKFECEGGLDFYYAAKRAQIMKMVHTS